MLCIPYISKYMTMCLVWKALNKPLMLSLWIDWPILSPQCTYRSSMLNGELCNNELTSNDIREYVLFINTWIYMLKFIVNSGFGMLRILEQSNPSLMPMGPKVRVQSVR